MCPVFEFRSKFNDMFLRFMIPRTELIEGGGEKFDGMIGQLNQIIRDVKLNDLGI